MLTFYSDLFLATQKKLSQVGQRVYFEHGKPNSWADGQHVVLGQDSIDFDMTLLGADAKEHSVTLLVRHVPPKHPQIQFPAEWMRAPVGGAANNWVNVKRSGAKFTAQVGEERFDVRIIVDDRDGKILTVELHNPIAAVSRVCEDAALTNCGPSAPETITREVSLRLIPQ